MKKLLLLLILFLIAVAVLSVWKIKPKSSDPSVKIVSAKIEDTPLSLEVLSTPLERAKGLSGRENLEEGKGILFVFPKEGKYGFWMKDMKFPIDIIWIDENFRIVGIENSLSPESYPESFYPPENIQYVIEVPAGFSQRHSVIIGEGLFLEARNHVLEGVF